MTYGELAGGTDGAQACPGWLTGSGTIRVSVLPVFDAIVPPDEPATTWWPANSFTPHGLWPGLLSVSVVVVYAVLAPPDAAAPAALRSVPVDGAARSRV